MALASLHGHPEIDAARVADRALITPYLTHPDPRLGGAPRSALKP